MNEAQQARGESLAFVVFGSLGFFISAGRAMNRKLIMADQNCTAYVVLRRKQLEKKIGLSRSAIYDRLNPKSPNFDPSFPKPIPLGARAIGFIEAEADTWLATRVEQSRKSA